MSDSKLAASPEKETKALVDEINRIKWMLPPHERENVNVVLDQFLGIVSAPSSAGEAPDKNWLKHYLADHLINFDVDAAALMIQRYNAVHGSAEKARQCCEYHKSGGVGPKHMGIPNPHAVSGESREEFERLLDKYADLATDLADGATQINFHNFHGEDTWPVVYANIRKAMALLLQAARSAPKGNKNE